MPSRTSPVGLVTILVNPDCPHCVQATDTLTAWCCDAGIPVAGVDLTRHPEAALRRDVEHSPAVVFERPDGPHVFAGFPDHEAFERFIR